MKKNNLTLPITILIALFAITATAQDDTPKVKNANNDEVVEEKGFKKENLFTGGGVTASFFSGGGVLGASPMLGYKFNDYFDGGIVLNFVHSWARDLWGTNDKLTQNVVGPGVFVRGYPIPFIFLQAQFEQNFISEKYTSSTSSSIASYKINANAPSLLLGGGYSTGRQKSGTTFFYVSILADVLKNWNSPYVDKRYDNNGNRRPVIVPVIRAGVNVGLFQKRYGYYE